MLIGVSILTDLRGKVNLEWVAEVIRGDNEQTIITRQKGELAGYLNYVFSDFLNIKGFTKSACYFQKGKYYCVVGVPSEECMEISVCGV